ncbi:hypothetical protein RN001_012308 [Aquatica leii]|uniref:Uncharacterized protein n=1 Tax=Aquatica leii TaxID=1421715 RepID=A0AAN7P746_9COLE|nr:hypothetical protein RN001_012308 [Aquatica leii]
MSSSESDDDAYDAKQVVKQPKQQKVARTNTLYQNLLNANNKFSEMLKNKIKQSEISPVPRRGLDDTREYEFNPVASSTHIGTPHELKQNKERALKVKRTVESSNNSSSSSDEYTIKSDKKRDSKTEVINISSTFANDTNRSSDTNDDVEDKKFNISSKEKLLIKPTAIDSSSDSEEVQIKSKYSGKHEITSNVDSSGFSTKLNKHKNKRPKNTSLTSGHTSFEKKSKPITLHRKPSTSSEEASGSDSDPKKSKRQQMKNKESKSVNHNKKKTVTSNKGKDKQISSSEESSSRSGSESDDVPTAISKNKPEILKKHTKNSLCFNKEEADRTKLNKKSSSEDNSSSSGSESDKMQHRKKPKVEKHNKFEFNRKKAISLNSENRATFSTKTREENSNDSSSSEEEEHYLNYNSSKFVEQKAANEQISPYARVKKYEKEASLQNVVGANSFLENKKSREVFLMQVPITVDPQSLVNIDISLTKAMRIVKLKKYDSVPVLEAQDDVSFYCNNEEHIQIVKPVGCIKIQRHLKDKSIVDLPKQSTNSVLFPNNLKERHPLFGSEFTKKINLEEHIQEKLKAAVEKYAKNKKKKEKKIVKTEKHEQPEEEIFKFLNQSLPSADSTSSKKKKKSKISGNDDNILKEIPVKKEKNMSFESETNTSFAEESFKKVKKKKNKEKYHAIGEGDTTDNKKRKKQDSDNDDTSKKKRKSDCEHEDSLIQQLLLNESATLKQKKKKKRKKSEREDD